MKLESLGIIRGCKPTHRDKIYTHREVFIVKKFIFFDQSYNEDFAQCFCEAFVEAFFGFQWSYA